MGPHTTLRELSLLSSKLPSKVDLDLMPLTWRIKGKPSVESLPKTLLARLVASWLRSYRSSLVHGLDCSISPESH